jgi:septal ring factor EnvC (AmiA/AmiB activator)
MRGFGAQGIALLLLAASAQVFSTEAAVGKSTGAALAAADVSELQQALQKSKAEADLIRTRNQKLEQRRQSLERRIAELREQILQQEQSMQPASEAVPARSGADDEAEPMAPDGKGGTAPEAEK